MSGAKDAEPSRRIKPPRWLAKLALVVLVVYGAGAGIVALTRGRQWQPVSYDVYYGGRIDHDAVVYSGTDGRFIILVAAQDPAHKGSYCYLVETRRKRVCATDGNPFCMRFYDTAFTSDPNPCGAVLDGIIEPPSFDARLMLENDRISFTTLERKLQGKRVVVIPRTGKDRRHAAYP